MLRLLSSGTGADDLETFLLCLFIVVSFFPLRLRIRNRMQGSDVSEITELDERTGTHIFLNMLVQENLYICYLCFELSFIYVIVCALLLYQ